MGIKVGEQGSRKRFAKQRFFGKKEKEAERERRYIFMSALVKGFALTL